GATLSYILAGRPPFEGEVVEILRAVKEGEIPPLRKFAPWVERPLEAVCLKAMARRPADRYPSARALATDVERWLADEPVSAYRDSFRARLSRWERRHRVLVYGAFTALAVAAFGLAVTASAVNEQRRVSDAARAAAEAKAEEAERNFLVAANAVYDTQSMTADQILNRVPGAAPMREALTSKAAMAFENLLAAKPDDTNLLARAARVVSNHGYALRAVGNFESATMKFRRAVELVDHRLSLLGADAGDADRKALAERLVQFVGYMRDHGLASKVTPEYDKLVERARPLVESLLARSRDQPDDNWRYEFAGRLDLYQGNDALERDDLPAARTFYTRALQRLGEANRLRVGWIWYPLWLAQAHRGLGLLAAAEGRRDEADRRFAEALKIARDCLPIDPDSPTSRTSWASRRP
ncbi:MAG: hypothetical protein U0835_02435, partial [Isosphaeraceae bacterium]